MMHKILLTSFTTWEAHQKSNSSDDLLAELQRRTPLSDTLHWLRQLPVDFDHAPQQAIAHVNTLQPDAVILCGMAESRQKLSIESRAVTETAILTTQLELDTLIQELEITEISHDAGRFVCNALYFSMLKHLRDQNLETHCLFVHVPILTPANIEPVLHDFQVILSRIRAVVDQKQLHKL